MSAKRQMIETLLTLIACAVLLALACAGALCVGSTHIDVWASLRKLLAGAPDAPALVLYHQRLPRVLMGALAGGSLALVGAAFQAILRNPLATPHTLGVSSGAALGAVVAIGFDVLHVRFWGFSTVQVFALLGSLASILIIYSLIRRRGRLSMTGLLLAGVTLSLICAALITLVRYVSSPHKLVILDRWLMGGVDVQGFGGLAPVMPLLLPGVTLLLLQSASLNQLSFGEELAAGRGVNVASLQRIVFFAGSLITASVVAVAGPIGFVGLIIPHALRRVIGINHVKLLPACFLVGGAFLVLADAFARTVVRPTEMPVGVITALLGGPFFIWLIVSRKFG